jgi:hypothetical protein
MAWPKGYRSRDKGLSLYSQGEYNETVNAYEEAIGLNPEDAEAWNQ